MVEENIHRIAPDELRELLSYNPDTGALVWRERADARPQWNTRYAGQEAGCIGARGYRHVAIKRYSQSACLAHRIAWAMHYGEWPDADVDHVNRDKSDNRLANLRKATRAENIINQPPRRSNTSGATGVSWCKKYNRWVAYIGIAGRRTHIGYFDTLDGARAAREAVAARVYGEFAEERS